MFLQNFLIFDRIGTCLFTLNPDPKIISILYGFLYSLESFVQRISPKISKDNDFFHYSTSNYFLVFYKTPSNLKFILIVSNDPISNLSANIGSISISSSSSSSLISSSGVGTNNSLANNSSSSSLIPNSSMMTTTSNNTMASNNSTSSLRKDSEQFFRNFMIQIHQKIFVEFHVKNPMKFRKAIDSDLFRKHLLAFITENLQKIAS
ncbi:Muscle-specific protein 20 [Sarcoptes scabiei]|nr:Muscle-specific protein 20 [Sarcoptes scabiei]